MTTNTAFITGVLNEVNKLRNNNRLNPVTLNRELTAAAYMHSRDMAQNDFLSHVGSNGSSFGERIADVGYNSDAQSENVAWGDATPESVVQSWFESDGHRANMLDPNATEMGVGYFRPANDTGNNHYWTQKFGSGDSNPESFIPDDVMQAINGPNYTNIDRRGNDTLTGEGGNDTLEAGNDTLLGDAWSNDMLIGGEGDDLLNGRADGGSGEMDTYTGGDGDDTFVLNQNFWAYNGPGHAVVTDFEVGADHLDFGGTFKMSLGSRTNSDGTVDSLISRGNDLVAVIQNVQLTEAQFDAARVHS